MSKPEVKQAALRLREMERRTVNEIAIILGVSKGTVSVWVRHLPLTKEEKKQRRLRLIETGALNNKKVRPKAGKFASLIGNLSRHQKSQLAETAVLYRLILHGLGAFKPVSAWDTADLLVTIPQSQKTVRVQIKCAMTCNKSGLPYVSLRRVWNAKTPGSCHMEKYHDGDFDILVGYDAISDVAYVWTWDEVSSKSTITVSEESAERWDKISPP